MVFKDNANKRVPFAGTRPLKYISGLPYIEKKTHYKYSNPKQKEQNKLGKGKGMQNRQT